MSWIRKTVLNCATRSLLIAGCASICPNQDRDAAVHRYPRPLTAGSLHEFVTLPTRKVKLLSTASSRSFTPITGQCSNRIIDKLMPIDIPEAGIYRFAFNRTVLHQIIDEFDKYLTKAERQEFFCALQKKRPFTASSTIFLRNTVP